MKQLIEDNYKVTIKRGLISPSTTVQDFIDKIYEEVDELQNEIDAGKTYNFDKLKYELADVILTCLNMSKHFNIDIEQQMKSNVRRNKFRIPKQ
jgi:NTP pyrophosphatase (non-canonical NTP hydrolase)